MSGHTPIKSVSRKYIDGRLRKRVLATVCREQSVPRAPHESLARGAFRPTQLLPSRNQPRVLFLHNNLVDVVTARNSAG